MIFSTRFLLSCLLAAVCVLLFAATPTRAMTRLDAAGVSKALRYGMSQSGMGLMSLLGGNWLEAADGTLLNIYTPYMLLAAKAARGGYPNNPGEDDVRHARKRYAGLISSIQSVRDPVTVKFSVALTGESAGFASGLKARIEGAGRGRAFQLRPTRQIQQKTAVAVPNVKIRPFEAINAYYFSFEDLMNMDEFRLILEDPRAPQSEPIVFRVRTDRIE
ncbi:MAG: hypothetical protein IPK79_02180 [Vampirovibrionales bacterium]|nr:hypothetical protein [Vampirovibrionales bacterium]